MPGSQIIQMGTGDKLTSNLWPYLNYYSVTVQSVANLVPPWECEDFTFYYYQVYYLIDQNSAHFRTTMPVSGRPCPLPAERAGVQELHGGLPG